MFRSILIYSIYLYLVCFDVSYSNSIGIGFVVLTQPDDYHDKLFKKKEKDILYQAKNLNLLDLKVFRSYELSNEAGHWTIFPLLEKLSTYEDIKWIIFLEEITGVNLKNLESIFQKYNSLDDIFVGYALQDNDPTIIHHFAEAASLFYPHFSAGFVISYSLVQKLALKLPVDDEYSFSIDPKYEFAKFIWDKGKGVKLQHEDQFCLVKSNENCATWIEYEFQDCGLPISSEKLHVAVKTCHKFHKDRITVVKKTWASDAENLAFFSDVEDNSIPTIKVDVENVDHGHCKKTLSILKYYVESDSPIEWLAVVDDDTLISLNRLKKLLSCYNASTVAVIGERYGYGVAFSAGYDYITGGGGMIFSFPAIKLLIDHCHCPSVNSPDDMIIGMCLRRLEVPVIHSPYFHQARPSDYSSDFLKSFKHISFHKHWMVDPYSVYKEWLQDFADTESHMELRNTTIE